MDWLRHTQAGDTLDKRPHRVLITREMVEELIDFYNEDEYKGSYIMQVALTLDESVVSV